MEINELKKKVHDIKLKCGELCITKEKGHITSALSCAELLVVLYYCIMNIDPLKPDWKQRDRFVMSKNHGSVITYPILQDLGFFSMDFLDSYQDDGSPLGTHSKVEVPGVDFGGGSLGIGLGVACGLAFAAKVDKEDWITYCMVGDCECEEGSIWESFMFAGHNKLNNLVVIMDRNDEGCTDFIDNLIPLNPLEDKLKSFGWDVWNIKDGHDIEEILSCFKKIKGRTSDKPLFISANTIKGNGIDFMVNVPWLHGQVPKGEQGMLALKQLKGDI